MVFSHLPMTQVAVLKLPFKLSSPVGAQGGLHELALQRQGSHANATPSTPAPRPFDHAHLMAHSGALPGTALYFAFASNCRHCLITKLPARVRPYTEAACMHPTGGPSSAGLTVHPRKLSLGRLSSLTLSDAAAQQNSTYSPSASTPIACSGTAGNSSGGMRSCSSTGGLRSGGAQLHRGFFQQHRSCDAMSVDAGDDVDADLDSLDSPAGLRRLSVSSPTPLSPLSEAGGHVAGAGHCTGSGCCAWIRPRNTLSSHTYYVFEIYTRTGPAPSIPT